MIKERQFKVCGITRVSDARAAVEAGADYLGFNFYGGSPRYISTEDFARIQAELPKIPTMAVIVNPEPAFIEKLKVLGFQQFQIHFALEGDYLEAVAQWRDAVGECELWLAPKNKPGASFDEALLPFADGILWDAYSKSAFGGTGHTSDWDGFRELSERFPEKKWILAGGLSPENLVSAAKASGSSIFDLNSGLETSPGIKDPERISMVRPILASL